MAAVPDGTGTGAWLDAPVESGPAAGFGVYLHVPFCSHRCGYCDFATSDRHGHLVPRYVAALRDQVRRVVAAGPPHGADDWPAVTSVFVGGGTPTLLPPADLAGLVTLVTGELAVVPDAEVTVECNPENASPALFEALVEAGVSRLSLGVQSFAAHVLATLERAHGVDRPGDAVRLARTAGIGEVSLDLMYGTPGETDADWTTSVRRAVALAPDHLSAYALTVHENTAFGRRVAAGRLPAPDDDVQARRFAVADELLADLGYDHYEISNWALGPARRSRHNVLYWRHGDYLGIGTGAHAHWRGRREWSIRGVDAWLAAAEAGASPVAGSEVLDHDERALERLMLGLRLREGLHWRDAPPIEPLALADAVAAGLVSTSCGRLQSTPGGWFLLDEAVRRLA